MEFELTYFNAAGEVRRSFSGEGWRHEGGRYVNDGLGMEFLCEETAENFRIPAESLRETGGNRFRSFIAEPDWLSLPQNEGELILPLGVGCICECRNKPTAEAQIPLFNYYSTASNAMLSLLASVHARGGVRLFIAEEGRLDAFLRLRTAYGAEKRYVAAFEFFFREYPDVPVQTSVSARRESFTGGIPEIAAHYRDYVKKVRGVVTLRERMRDNPVLQRSARSVEVRFRLAVKQLGTVAEQTPETQPPMYVFMTFPMVGKTVAEFKRQNVKNVEFNLVGWNYGGHDGAYPQVFPVEERLGGEKELRKLLTETAADGYNISIHDNYYDMYPLAENFSLQNALRAHDGSPVRIGIWGGGSAYLICPRAARKYYEQNRDAIAKLPLSGTYYVDVYGCVRLIPCYDREHPVTRAQTVEIWNSILNDLKKRYGATMSEGGREWIIPAMDRAYAVANNYDVELITTDDGRVLPLVDRNVPLFSMVYHGSVLFNMTRTWINAFPGSPEYLRNLAYGGIPLYYYHLKFQGERWQDDLRYSTPAALQRDVAKIGQAAADTAALEDLIPQEIVNIIEDGESWIETVYEDGTRVLTNLGEQERTFNTGETVPARSFRIVRK